MQSSITPVLMVGLLQLLIQDGVESKDQSFTELHAFKRQSLRDQQGPFGDAVKTAAIMKLILMDYYFSDSVWQNVMIYLATPHELKDPAFRTKWKITDKREKKIRGATDLSALGREEKLLIKFHDDPRNGAVWRGLIALGSSKADLMDPEYRAKWGLGEDISSEVRDGQDGDNYFHGPQFNEFLIQTGQKNDVDPTWADNEVYDFLTNWFQTVFSKMKKSDDV